MTKLKIEDLEITSFATTPGAVSRRGTVLGAGRTDKPGCVNTYGGCADTEYFDCTLGCTRATNCVNGCIEM